MRYFVIPFIALGLALSLLFGVKYTCSGEEMFPDYYGSPFIFKEKSLASSMQYYFSLSGIVLNTAVWSVPVALLRFTFIRFFKLKSIIARTAYRSVIVILIAFSVLNIWISFVAMGNGFGKDLNYWSIDMDKKASAGKMNCIGKWGFMLL